MICFDFIKMKMRKEPTILTALKDVKYVISPYLKLEADVTECDVVEFGREPNFHVAYPPSSLGRVTLDDVEVVPNCYPMRWKGRITIEGKKSRSFSIQGGIMYINKCRY